LPADLQSDQPIETAASDYDPYEPAQQVDPYPWYDVLRRECPVHHYRLRDQDVDRFNASPYVARPTTDFYTVSRHQDVRAVLRDAGLFSSLQGPGPERLQFPEGAGMLAYADDPAHSRQRRILGKAFRPRIVHALTGRIALLCDELVDAIVERGRCDLIPEFADVLPIVVICEMFGTPLEMRSEVRRWSHAILSGWGGGKQEWEASARAYEEFGQYIVGECATRRSDLTVGEEPTDFLEAMMNAPYEDRQFNPMEIVMASQQLLIGGYEAVSAAIGSGVLLFCTHPQERRKLEDKPELLERFVEEVVRFESPAPGMFRTPKEPTELAGCPLPADAKVRVMYGSANRDPDVFPDGDEFLVERTAAQLRRHLAFGTGVHSCIGVALARAELRIAFGTLFARLPGLRLAPESEPRWKAGFMTRSLETLPVVWDVN
jgi:cytochrome P450